MNNEKINKIAKKIIGFKDINQINTKEEFLDYLVSSINTIHFIFGSDIITASSKEDLDITFLKLKEKIQQWKEESKHTQPFYPRNFIKKILKSCANINFIDRKDNPNKMRPEDYLIKNQNDMKQFILKRIDKDDEVIGLKFKENEMFVTNDETPLDVYNAIAFNYRLNKKTRMYIKFKINKNFTDAYFNMNFISIHDDRSQI